MELSGYLAVIRRWWWTLLVATWVAGLSGYLVASQLPKVYEAEVRLLVGPINTDVNTQRAAGQLAQTYAELITSQPLLERVISELGLSTDVQSLQAAVGASPNDVTRFVTIRVQDENPQLAARIANSLAQELAELASGSSGIARPEGEVQVIDFADPPTTPIAPQVTLITLLAAAAGLLGAIVLVLVIEYTSDAIRSGDELARATGQPVLAVLRTGDANDAELVATVPSSRPAVAYRLLTAKLELRGDGRPLGSILAIGEPGDDVASAVATNAAVALATRGHRVALVDGSATGAASALVERDDGPRLAEALAGGKVRPVRATFSPAVAIDVLPTAETGVEPANLEQVRSVLAGLHQSADVVVIVAPPVEESAGTLLWAKAVDAVVVVVPRDATKRSSVRSTLDALDLVGARVAGAVLTEGRGRSAARRREARPPVTIQPVSVASEPAASARPASRRTTRARTLPPARPSPDLEP